MSDFNDYQVPGGIARTHPLLLLLSLLVADAVGSLGLPGSLGYADGCTPAAASWPRGSRAGRMSFFGRGLILAALIAGTISVFRKDLTRILAALRKPTQSFIRDVASELEASSKAGAAAAAPPPPLPTGAATSAAAAAAAAAPAAAATPAAAAAAAGTATPASGASATPAGQQMH